MSGYIDELLKVEFVEVNAAVSTAIPFNDEPCWQKTTDYDLTTFQRYILRLFGQYCVFCRFSGRFSIPEIPAQSAANPRKVTIFRRL